MTSSTVFKEFLTRKRHRIAENWCANALECGVCGEQFSISGEKVPRLLLCGHSFCHNCLTRLPLCGGSLACPMDRQITEVGGSGIWGLKKNFALIELMEKLQIRGMGQRSPNSVSNLSSAVREEKQRNGGPRCDEDENHEATLYCLVCCTNLCADCALSIHSTKTLSKHRRVALEDKPTEPTMCPLHQTHALEFACLDPNCQFNPAMCYLCKEHGQHKGHQHGLLEVVAHKCRASTQEAADRAVSFLSRVEEHANKIQQAINLIEGTSHVSNSNGSMLRHHMPGTLVSAQQCVKDYFSRLHDTLSNQEDVAISNLEGHVRSRITALRRIHDDTTSLHSHISAALTHCNDVLDQDESSILCAQQEIDALDQMFDQQQRQFNEQISSSTDALDPSIPVTFTKDNRIHIGRKLEIRVVTLGLDGAGKTTLLFKLKQDEFMQPIPTIGFNVETVDFRNLRFTVWDVGGKHKLRPLWKHYYLNTQAVLFVVDSCDGDRFEEAHQELAKLMSEKDLRDAALLVLANKQDLPGAIPCEELATRLNLHKLCCGRSWRALPCDAATGSGLEEALQWLSRQLVAAGVLDVV